MFIQGEKLLFGNTPKLIREPFLESLAQITTERLDDQRRNSVNLAAVMQALRSPDHSQQFFIGPDTKTRQDNFVDQLRESRGENRYDNTFP
jgi:hypothetical protein